MSETQWSFLDSKGPRALLGLRITTDTHAALEVAGAEMGLTKNAFATLLVEGWADEWIARESGTSEAAPVQDETATGRSVQGG
jgi:hypothetical protein